METEERERISIREDSDREQAAYLSAWRDMQEQKAEELKAIRQRVSDGKETKLQAIREIFHVYWQYRVCNAPDHIV